MPALIKTRSIKNLLITVVMSISTLSLIVAFTVNTLVNIDYQKERLVKAATIYADIVAFNAASGIIFEDPENEEESLKALAVTDIVDNLHIYNVSTFENKLEFFASYNKQGLSPVPPKFDQVEALKEPKFSASHMEIIRPISYEGTVIGYVYLKATLNQLNSFIFDSIWLTIAAATGAIVLSLLITLRVQRSISWPIQSLVGMVQKVSRNKDYSVRVDPQPLKELKYLGDAFNNMLDRIQMNTEKQLKTDQEIRQLNQNLEEKVTQRTVALKEANQELLQTLEKLHQYQNQLVENEKMASLGDMVAGVAHEVNTPIGLGVTASTLLKDRMDVIRDSFHNKTLKASQLEKFLNESEENLGIIYRNLNRSAELISSFKQVAVDQSTQNNRVFGFKQLMNEILLSLRPKLKKTEHEVVVECDDSLTIESKPGPINQIMINLIMNSLIHGFEFMEKGQIRIIVEMMDSHNICIQYKDNGKGVPEHLRKRIFDPFVTTKRGEGGSGLGMHLVYNLVTQALQGTITLESEENQGVDLELIFPVRKIDSEDVKISS